MKWSNTVVLTTVACVLTAWTVSGQSLTEAAAKEKERRNKAKSGKTYTENELRSAGQGFSPEATADAPTEGATNAAASTDGSKPAPDAAAKADEERAKKEKAWSDKFKAAETEHRQWSEEAASIQTQLADTSVAQYGPGRQRATQALNEATAKVAALQRQMADLEEEGRRNRFKR